MRPGERIRRLIAVVFLGAGLGAAFAARVGAEGTGGDAAPYLRAGAGARGLGLGNAQTAAADDASAAYWNPAALTRLGGIGVASQFALLGERRSWNFLNYCQSGSAAGLGRFGFGASWINFSAGDDLEARTANRPEPDAVFGDMQNAFLISAAADFHAQVSFGVTLKLLTHALDNETANGFGVDLALWQPLGNFSWGLVLQDAYTALDWAGRYADRLPTLTRAGVAWAAIPGELVLAADGSAEWTHAGQEFSSFRARLGAEYRLWRVLAVRAGLDGDRFACGAGVAVPFGETVRGKLDYALTAEQLPGAGPSHALSLVLDLKLPQPAAKTR